MIVYSKPDCQACVATKRKLDSLGITYEERDALANLDELRSMGHSAAPVVVTPDGESWSGYRPDRLRVQAAIAA